jgi:hypothetical protein
MIRVCPKTVRVAAGYYRIEAGDSHVLIQRQGGIWLSVYCPIIGIRTRGHHSSKREAVKSAWEYLESNAAVR